MADVNLRVTCARQDGSFVALADHLRIDYLVPAPESCAPFGRRHVGVAKKSLKHRREDLKRYAMLLARQASP